MQYISPISFLKLDIKDPNDLTGALIKRLKRRTLADFELSDDIVLDYKGTSIDRATALKLIEELEDPNKRLYHWKIHQHRGLLEFLEKGNVAFLRKVPRATNFEDDGFRNFLSPLVANLYQDLLGKNLKDGKYPEVSLLLQHRDLIQPAETDYAFQKMVRIINQKRQEIHDLAITGDGPTLYAFRNHSIYNPDFIRALNGMPDQLQQVRNNYAVALKNLGIAMQNELSRTSLAYNLVSAAADLQIDYSIREEVESIQTQLEAMRRQSIEATAPGRRHTGSKSRSAANQGLGCVVRIGVMVGLIIALVYLRLSLRDSGSGVSYYNPNLPDTRAITQNALSTLKDFEKTRKLLDAMNASNPYVQDFIVFSRLNSYTEKINNGGEVFESSTDGLNLRPETGANPYYSNLDYRIDSSLNSTTIEVRNKSNKDQVIFFSRTEARDPVVRDVYIRKGEKVIVKHLPAGKLGYRLYAGREWVPDVLSGPTGAFMQSPETIPIEKGKYLRKLKMGTLQVADWSAENDSLNRANKRKKAYQLTIWKRSTALKALK